LESAPVEVLAFADVTAAEQARTAGQIQAYYHLPDDYWQTGQVNIVYDQPPVQEIDDALEGWITQSIRQKIPPPILTQLDHTPDIDHHDLAGNRADTLTDLIVPLVIFAIVYFVQLASSFTASYMFDSIASEAGDRTIEILLTSVSPLQFLTGNVVGLLMVGLTQLAAWGGLAIILVTMAAMRLGINPIRWRLTWEHFGILISLLLATSVLYQLLAAVVGLLQVNSGSGMLLFNTLNWVVGIGWLYAIALIPPNPNTPLAVITSLFPLTAPNVLLLRLAVTDVPLWQLIASQVLIWGSCIATLYWLRYLLQTNLVAYAPRFRLRDWLRSRLAFSR
jgi:ABC-2 type transport system permease protein